MLNYGTHRLYQRRMRDDRMLYSGGVKLLLPFGAMQLLLSMQAMNVSSTGILANLPTGRLSRQLKESLPESLIAVGDSCQLQLEHDFEHFPAAMLDAQLVRRDVHGDRWDMAFSFRIATQELLSLLHNLSSRPDRPSFH